MLWVSADDNIVVTVEGEVVVSRRPPSARRTAPFVQTSSLRRATPPHRWIAPVFGSVCCCADGLNDTQHVSHLMEFWSPKPRPAHNMKYYA